MKNYKILLTLLCVGVVNGFYLHAQQRHVPKNSANNMAAWYNGTSFRNTTNVNGGRGLDNVQGLLDLSDNVNHLYNQVAERIGRNRVTTKLLNFNKGVYFAPKGSQGGTRDGMQFRFDRHEHPDGKIRNFPKANQPQTFYAVALNEDPIQGYIFTINSNSGGEGGATLGARSEGSWNSQDLHDALIVGRSFDVKAKNNYWGAYSHLLRAGYDPKNVGGKTFVYSEAGHNYSYGNSTWGVTQRYDVFVVGGTQPINNTNAENNTWTGTIGEVLVYNGVHDVETARKIQTYLAIKFGVTLVPLRKNEPEVRSEVEEKESPYTKDELKEAKEYVNVNGESVWTYSDPYRAEGFNNHIFGLAKDGEDIDQQVSHSTNVPDGAPQLTMAVDNLFKENGTDKDIPNKDFARHSLENGKYAMFGNNGENGVNKWRPIPEGICLPGKKYKSMLAKVWKSEMTGDIPAVYGRLDLTSFTQISEPFVVVASNPNFTGDLQVITEANTITVANGVTTVTATEPGTISMEPNKNVIRFKYKFDGIKYFSFGGDVQKFYKNACAFDGVKELNFLTSEGGEWKKHFTTGKDWVFNLGDDFNVTMRIEGTPYDNNTPREYYEGLLLERRVPNESLETTFTMNKAALASFHVKDLDEFHTRYDNVIITGYDADGVEVYPLLSYVDSPGRSTYTIIGNAARTHIHDTYSYNDPRAELFVEFTIPVQKIKVDYITDYEGLQDIGLTGFQFYCPDTLPEKPLDEFTTEDGGRITFTKSTPSKEVRLCEEVPFVFEIENEGCTDQTINFEDTLPEGMYWVEGSVTFPTDEATANEYKGIKDLKITNLVIPKSSVLRVRAKARFNSEATAKNYGNRAFISIEDGKKFGSVDKFTREEETVVTATGVFSHKTLEVKSLGLDGQDCFAPGGQATVTLELENKDGAHDYENIRVDMTLGKGFSYVDQSLKGGEKETNVGYGELALSVVNVNVPAGETRKITFKVNTPSTVDSDKVVVVESINVSDDSNDSCGSSIVVPEQFQKLEAGKCEDCKKAPKTGGDLLETKVGFSTLKHDNDDWVNNAKNGFIKMESMDRPFVITRMTTAQRNAIQDKVEGMMIWNIDTQCLELYKGETLNWVCIKKGCNNEVSRQEN